MVPTFPAAPLADAFVRWGTLGLTPAKVRGSLFSTYTELHAAELGALTFLVFLVVYAISRELGVAFLGGLSLVALVPSLAHPAIAAKPWYFLAAVVLGLGARSLVLTGVALRRRIRDRGVAATGHDAGHDDGGHLPAD